MIGVLSRVIHLKYSRERWDCQEGKGCGFLIFYEFSENSMKKSVGLTRKWGCDRMNTKNYAVRSDRCGDRLVRHFEIIEIFLIIL